MTFAEQMRLIRGNLTQSAFCRRLKIPLTTYQRYEKGTRVPDIEVFARIVKTMGIPADTLLNLDGGHGSLSDENEGKTALARLSCSCSCDPKDLIIARQAAIIETLTHTIDSLAERINPETGGALPGQPGKSTDEVTAA